MTREQHIAALARANEVRLARAALKREVAELPQPEGLERLAVLILDPPKPLWTARLDEVLTWPRRMGQARARRILHYCYLAEHKPVGSLTDRQRWILARRLRPARGDTRAAPADRMAPDG